MSDLHRRDTSLTTQTPYGDPSSKIWGLYLSEAEKFDKEHSESWTANTEGVLVFVRHNSSHEIVLFLSRRPDQTGLFSAVVAAFLIVSYPLLQPNPTEITNQLLTQISQQLSTNGTGSSQPLPPANTSSFRPPSSAVRVNVLWFISLAMSTACALWATLMQQWTRRYMQVADRPYGPPKRARIRAFFAKGVENFALAAAVEVLPGLLHASVLIFYIGLIDFLMNINHTVAFFLLTWVAIGCLVYFILTIMPLFYPNSPYQTPLSSLCWFVLEATPLLRLWVRRRNETVKTAIRERRSKIGQGMRRALESKATRLKAQADADTSALGWTLRSLDEDHELEEFLDGLPGLFHGSSRHHSLGLRGGLEQLVRPVADKLFATCTTGLLPEGLSKTTSHGLSQSYLVLLWYRRSPFSGDLGSMGQVDQRCLGTIVNGDMGSGIEYDDRIGSFHRTPCSLHSGTDGRHVEQRQVAMCPIRGRLTSPTPTRRLLRRHR